MIEMRNTGFRVDNNYFDNQDVTKWLACVNTTATDMTVRPTGVVDSNTFNNCKLTSFGSTNFTKDNGFWAADSVVGAVGTVYFEDNNINRGEVASVMTDCNYGGSYVFRYNTFNIATDAMAHSIQGAQHRACKSWEVYGNTFTYATSTFGFIGFFRSGTGMFYNNYITGPYSSAYTITLDNVRSGDERTTCCGTTNPDSAPCDGNSAWDGNTAGQSGWPCRDQVGRGKDSATFNTTTYAASTSEPAYFWLNKRSTGANISPSVSSAGYNATHITANRDYYNYTASFNGSSGVGCGTLANIPGTCTVGVGYWATNQSCSDLTGMVGAAPETPISGTLYKCTETDTWTAYYTPYTYPHPLRDVTAPDSTITQSDPQAITSDALTLTGTCTDAVGVTSAKYRLSSSPDGSNGTVCTGTTSWTCNTSGYSIGANDVYVGCADAAGNWTSPAPHITANFSHPDGAIAFSSPGTGAITMTPNNSGAIAVTPY